MKRPIALPAVAFLAALFVFFTLPGRLAAQQAGDSPVKIFILAGQSNMVGMGQISPATTPGTLEYIAANDPDYAFLGDGSGGFEVLDDVWIRYNRDGGIGGDLTAGYGGGSDRVGPELGFGHAVGELYEKQVLLIKYAVGGRDLDNDFRPPSSGYDYAEGEGPVSDGDQGYHYQQILDMVGDVTANLSTYFPGYNGNGYEIAGFAWHQGYNDRIDSGRSAAYETNMANFINDIRSDLGTPGMPFVIATTSMGTSFNYSQVEKAQLAMADAAKYPAFEGNVKVVDASQPYGDLTFWQSPAESPRDEGYHWNRNAKTYTNLGLAMADAISTMVPARCPYRLEASGDSSGVTLSWSEGTETPSNLQILRDSVEIAASAPLTSPSFLDTAAEPGLIEYELNFTMPGDPCPPLTLTFDAGITDAEAYRLQSNVKLTWTNNLDYDVIEVRRDGVLIEPALDGAATSYLDSSPPESGTATYSLVPTNGSATPTEVSINLDGLSPGNAYIYESFEDGDPSLDGNATGAGLLDVWIGGLSVAADSLSYGLMPTSGNQAVNTGGNTSAGALIRPEFAEAGLLDHGRELWFSFLTNNPSSVNTAVYFHLGTDRSDFFGGMPSDGEGIGVNIANGSTPQATTWAPGRSAASSSGSIADDTTALVVGKITWGADGASVDTIEIYLPATDLVLPAAPVSTQSAVLDQSQFDMICFGGKNGDAPNVDEIRFAETYDDVVALGQIVSDSETPDPDPMTWASPPAADGDNSITMTATTASDNSGVEYYFTETSGQPGGSDSGWQDSPTYTNTGLEPETTYTYTVKARDKSFDQNETVASAPAQATTDPLDTTPPATPGFAIAPIPLSATEIAMTATEVTDPSGVEYRFTETSGLPGGTSSEWQEEPTYTDTGLDPETTYTYTVTARDMSVNQNESGTSPGASATTPAAPSGPGGALIYEPFDDNDPTLSGNTPGIGLTGTWSGGYDVAPGSFLYGSLAVSGNRAVINSGRTGSSVSTGTTLSDVALLNDGATLWFGVLHLTQPNASGNMDFGFALGSNGLSGRNAVPMSGQGIGFSVKNGSILASAWDDSDGSDNVERTSSGASFSYGEAVLVVGEIIWGSDGADDTINLYLPDTDLNLGSVVSTFSRDLTQTNFDTITFSNKADEVPVGIDEIRFGFSYEDAVGLGGESNDYDDWAGNYSGADLSDPAGDFDGDGFSNEEERVWGLDPTSAASVNPVTVPLDPNTGTLTYTRRKPSLSGISYGYEWSNTLAADGWTPFTPATEVPDGGDPVESVEITLDNSLLQETKLFIRVEAVTP